MDSLESIKIFCVAILMFKAKNCFIVSKNHGTLLKSQTLNNEQYQSIKTWCFLLTEVKKTGFTLLPETMKKRKSAQNLGFQDMGGATTKDSDFQEMATLREPCSCPSLLP